MIEGNTMSDENNDSTPRTGYFGASGAAELAHEGASPRLTAGASPAAFVKEPATGPKGGSGASDSADTGQTS